MMWFVKRFESTKIGEGILRNADINHIHRNVIYVNFETQIISICLLQILQIMSSEYLPESQPVVRVFLRNIV